MPTYVWTRTREQLRDMILRKLGVLGAMDTASAEDATVVYEAMDARLKELHGLRLLWWGIAAAQTDVTITAGQATATIGATDFLFPVTLAVRVGTEDRPLDIIGHRQYQEIPDKSQTGEPEAAFVSGSTIRLHPVPQANYTGKLTYQSIASDVANGEPIGAPTALMRSLATLIASDLVDEYGLTPERAQRLLVAGERAMKTIRAVTAERVQADTVSTDFF